MLPVSVIKRDGREVQFDSTRIFEAIQKAYIEVHGETNEGLIRQVTDNVLDSIDHSRRISVEEIQDQVEKSLAMIDFPVAREYIIYRERAANNRSILSSSFERREAIKVRVSDATGGLDHIDEDDIVYNIKALSDDTILSDEDIDAAMLLEGRARIEEQPEYTYFTANVLLRQMYSDIAGVSLLENMTKAKYEEVFIWSLCEGVAHERMDPELLTFDIEVLTKALDPDRDYAFQYLGLQILYDRYFLHIEGKRIELPQTFWMRVAMGLALAEAPAARTERAIEFYNALSQFLVCSSTPTLFNAGTLRPQLSSCYLQTVEDDLASIFKLYADSAQLSKWAGGLGVDFTPIRSLGSHIKGVNGKSSGTVPFLKIMNDTAAGVSQAGKRRGSAAVYMEVWHADIEEFIELRKNTGDERRRTHDLNLAAWIPDLFMQRVKDNGKWTLLSPSAAPELHDTYGQEFVHTYAKYEHLVKIGAIQGKEIQALDLWRKLLGSLFETGHPWITFKDPSNIRYTNSHVGVVHSSNLCTEILLHTSPEEVAVCNLASINLPAHIRGKELDNQLLQSTIRTAVRMLDNVIDINFYPVKEARESNLKHRPVGLGIMGFQDCLWMLNFSYASKQAIEFADASMELISLLAIEASSLLAAERGTYKSYKGSKWDQGILPIDSVQLLAGHRGEPMENSRIYNWLDVRDMVSTHGMRNSNVMAIAPTATISNIQGVTQSIEPMFSNLFVKSNLSGEFTMVNDFLVRELRDLGLWDANMLEEIKYWDGSIAQIERIPLEVRVKYPTAFEIEPEWLIECAARRQKWIDMGQSLNLYISEPSGKRLHDMYFLAWEKGLKTTYYLRSRGATTVEKSTIDVNKFGIQPRWSTHKSASSDIVIDRSENDLVVDDFEDFICETCT